MNIESFQQKYPGLIYQDIVVGNQIYPIGTDLCEPRYELIKPVFDLYKRPFSVLDLGAAQGYFSFRIAQDFPQSSCVMVEANATSYYANHGSMLYDLCWMNRHLNNIFYLDRRMDLSDLSFLTNNEHFDVVLALLVVHLMHDTLQEQIKIINALLNLADNLIVEVANDVNVLHTAYVEFLSHSIDCQFLGEVKRHKDPKSTSTGKLFWFTRKASQSSANKRVNSYVAIKKKTFFHLHGVYPEDLTHVPD